MCVKPHEVLVRFGPAVPTDLQGPALLKLEKWLREAGVPAEAYKDSLPDDSRVRLNAAGKRKALS